MGIPYAPTLQNIREALEPCAAKALDTLAAQAGASFPSDEMGPLAAISQAASLKRIADAVELLAHGDNDLSGLLPRR